MVASTDIKFYVHTNTNAPQLTNNYGRMIAVLDACLVNGFGSQAVSSIAAADTTITVTFGSAHNYMQYQVIRIAGAVQTEYNGQHRILSVPSATTLTFELAAAPSASPATGTMTCDLPPLGWEKPFGNTGGKAAYRSTNLLLPSRPFLRVVDEVDAAWDSTYAKYAKVGIVEDMTDIDTMLGVQAPYDSASANKNWVGTGTGTAAINGWAKWYYARSGTVTSNSSDAATPASGNRNWLLVGNSDYFFIFPGFAPNNNTDDTRAGSPYGFGAFERLYADDTSNVFLNASMRDVSASVAGQIGLSSGISASEVRNILLYRPIEQAANYWTANSVFAINSATQRSGSANYLASSPNKIPLYPVILEEPTARYGSSPKTVRGALPGIYALGNQLPFLDFQVFSRGNSVFIARHCTAAASTGQMVLKVGEL